MHYSDMSPYGYYLSFQLPQVYNVGWLDSNHPYPTGKTSPEFRAKLVDLCLSRQPFNSEVNLIRGARHACNICGAPSMNIEKDGKKGILGASEIWVPGANGTHFASPSMIVHYVLEHDYLPPPEYIETVLKADLGQSYSGQDSLFSLLLEKKKAGK